MLCSSLLMRLKKPGINLKSIKGQSGKFNHITDWKSENITHWSICMVERVTQAFNHRNVANLSTPLKFMEFSTPVIKCPVVQTLNNQ